MAEQKWEYLTEFRRRGTNIMGGAGNWDNNVPDRLTLLGEQGWELVAVVPRNGNTVFPGYTDEELWIFKKPKA